MWKICRISLIASFSISSLLPFPPIILPGLKDDRYHSIAEKNMRGFGGMLSFRVKGGIKGELEIFEENEYLKNVYNIYTEAIKRGIFFNQG